MSSGASTQPANEDVVDFLETALNQEHPPLHILDGFSDVCALRMDSLLPTIAIMESAGVKLPELQENDDRKKLEKLLIQKLHIPDRSEYGHFSSRFIGLTFAVIPRIPLISRQFLLRGKTLISH